MQLRRSHEKLRARLESFKREKAGARRKHQATKHTHNTQHTTTRTRTAAHAQMETVGNYRMGRVLGTGGFSEVRLGTHVTSGERCAVKCLERNAQNTDERIKDEIYLTQVRV